MERTLTLEQAKRRSALDLIQEAIEGHEPLIISLEDGTVVSIQEYRPSLMTEQAVTEAPLTLKPLP